LFVLSAGVTNYANGQLRLLNFAVADAREIGEAMRRLAAASMRRLK